MHREENLVQTTLGLTHKMKSFEVVVQFVDGKYSPLTNVVGPNSQLQDLKKCYDPYNVIVKKMYHGGWSVLLKE